jgi:hypothetical protein
MKELPKSELLKIIKRYEKALKFYADFQALDHAFFHYSDSMTEKAQKALNYKRKVFK